MIHGRIYKMMMNVFFIIGINKTTDEILAFGNLANINIADEDEQL
jgi:hypothetical protein